MTRLDKFNQTLNKKTLIVFDPISIKYLSSYDNDAGERLKCLIFKDGLAPTLIINQMFPKPSEIDYITYNDGDDINMLLNELIPNGDVYVDGNLPSRFLIPLINDNRHFINGSYLIEKMRNIKDKDELDLMKTASFLNDEIMALLPKYIKEGISEKELADIIVKLQSTAPLEGVSFEPISVFSENIADPHAIPSDRKLKKGDVILIDMGGCYKGYKSDMTRAFFFGENKKLEELYDIVLEANLAAIDAIKIGVPLSEVDKAARSVIEAHDYGDYFIHRTGHGIGLETHENLDVSSTNETLIEEGMCFSIEPGIYLEGIGGIRIEDLVCIEDGEAYILNTYTKDKVYL